MKYLVGAEIPGLMFYKPGRDWCLRYASSLSPEPKISFMIDKYDKDFLPPDRPVPTAVNTHRGDEARSPRANRGRADS